MSQIKGKDTKPEQFIRKCLFSKGFRYRKNYAGVFGRPDIWMPKYNVAIFVHGCFWHRHKDCKYAYIPKSNTEFWTTKFNHNIQRDQKVRTELMNENIRCLIIWECTTREMIKSSDLKERYLTEIVEFIEGNSIYQEI